MVVTIDVNPVAIHLGPFAIAWYGLAVGLGIATGIWLTLREAQRKGLNTDAIADLIWWVVLGGLVGARLFHVIDRWDLYSSSLLRALDIHSGGLAIEGAILGGAVAGGFAAWRKGLPLGRLFDAVAPGVVLGQAIGRFGCLVTGDSLGLATNGTWGIVYLNPGAVAPQLGVAYQPVFFYEQLWDLVVFAVVWALRRRLTTDGRLFALYLGLYPLGKFTITYFRRETIWIWGLQEAQLLALGAMAIAVVWFLASARAARRGNEGGDGRVPATPAQSHHPS